MRPTKFATLHSFLKQSNNRRLNKVIQQTKSISRADQQLKSYLSPGMAENISVMNIDANTLILKASSPAWSSRTRFMTREILHYMRNQPELAMLEHIKVKVSLPDHKSNKPKKAKIRKLSKNTAELLNSTAETVEDERLSKILRRIAAHH